MTNGFTMEFDVRDFSVNRLRQESNNIARNYYSDVDNISAYRHIYTSALLEAKYEALPVHFMGDAVEWPSL